VPKVSVTRPKLPSALRKKIRTRKPKIPTQNPLVPLNNKGKMYLTNEEVIKIEDRISKLENDEDKAKLLSKWYKSNRRNLK